MPDETQAYIEANDNANDYNDAQMGALIQPALEDIDNMFVSGELRDDELWNDLGINPELVLGDYDDEPRDDRDLNWVEGLAGISAAATIQFFLDHKEKAIINPVAYRQQVVGPFDLSRGQLVIAGRRGFEIEGKAQFAKLKKITDKRLLGLQKLGNSELYAELVDIGAMRPIDKAISDSIGYVSRMTNYAPDSPQFVEAVNDLISSDSKRGLQGMNRRAVEQIYTASEVDGDVNRMMVWIVEGGKNTCSYCNSRAGQVKKYTEWLEEGLPGADVCRGGDLCRCHLAAS